MMAVGIAVIQMQSTRPYPAQPGKEGIYQTSSGSSRIQSSWASSSGRVVCLCTNNRAAGLLNRVSDDASRTHQALTILPACR